MQMSELAMRRAGPGLTTKGKPAGNTCTGVRLGLLRPVMNAVGLSVSPPTAVGGTSNTALTDLVAPEAMEPKAEVSKAVPPSVNVPPEIHVAPSTARVPETDAASSWFNLFDTSRSHVTESPGHS